MYTGSGLVDADLSDAVVRVHVEDHLPADESPESLNPQTIKFRV